MPWPETETDRTGGGPGEEVLSPATLARLRAAGGGPDAPGVFTMSGPAADLASLARSGLRPASAVRGSSVHHVGPVGPAPAASAEVPDLTRSLYTARHFALARLTAAASVVGAVGVVGVTMEHRPRAFGSELVEIVVTGTAVVETEVDGRPAPVPGRPPWTTGAGPEELSVLVGSGMVPVSVVFGTCVHHLDRRAVPETEWPGEEIPGWTLALTDAREVALARLQAEAQRSRADGVTGLVERELDHAWSGDALEYLVTGNAVRRRRRPPGRPPGGGA